jgi:N-acetyl sugar amidotransferase
MIRFCSKCILPDTRPNLYINNNGICNACISHEQKPSIDWKERGKNFVNVVKNAKFHSKGYDCIIPVSGGKDSTWQIVKCLEYGLNPLAVTWKTPARTKLGQENLDNLVSIGVDHIDYQINPKVEAKFLLEALLKYGSTGIPQHMAMFNIPTKIAVRFGIPLIIWGENSAFEYGGTEDERKGFELNSRWLKKFGVTHGTSAEDWISQDLTEKELTPYFRPTDKEIENSGVLAIFLGFYFPWDVETSLIVAQNNGFKVREKGPKLGYYNYADIDCDFMSIHHWFKWYKFGFTRTMDNLSLEIRNKRLTRNEALAILEKRGFETPIQDIEKFCQYVGITRKNFFEICERFRNTNIWKQDNYGNWFIKGFLIDNWKAMNEVC